jgi:hypothetical protein
MRLSKLKTSVTALMAGVAILGLSACMQTRQEAKVLPQPTPSGFGLFYTDEGASVKLAYGAPHSDDVGFMMQCAKGSRRVEITDVARGGAGANLTLSSQGHATALKIALADGDGTPILVARTTADAPPLQAFRRSGRIDLAYAGKRYSVMAGPAEKVRVERFFSACERAA